MEIKGALNSVRAPEWSHFTCENWKKELAFWSPFVPIVRLSFQSYPLGSLLKLRLLSAAGCGRRIFTAAGRCDQSFAFLRSKSPFQTRLSRCYVCSQAESIFWNHGVNFQSEEKGLWNASPQVCPGTNQAAPVGQICCLRDSPWPLSTALSAYL